MGDELLPLIQEICYLAVLRNEINTRRHRARFRKSYYANAIAVVEAHQGSNAKLRHLERHNINGKYQARIDSIKSDMTYLKNKHKNPKKWISMGLHQLRSLVLRSQAEYAMAKHETMEFTIKHRDRVKYLTGELGCFLMYDNGAVNSILFKGSLSHLYKGDILKYAEQYELNQAIEVMVKE